jgi:hypothetical protein
MRNACVIVNICEYAVEREKEKENKKRKKEKEEHTGTVETDGLTDDAWDRLGTNVIPHLYRMLCTGWIPGTNEGFQPAQMSVFPVVRASNTEPNSRQTCLP